MYGTPVGYRENHTPEYCDNSEGAPYQQNVYDIAVDFARRWNVEYLVDIGCGMGDKLAPLMKEFKVIGFDYGRNIEVAKERYPQGIWREVDLETGVPFVPTRVSANAVFICSDVIEHLRSPINLLRWLNFYSHWSPWLIVSTPNRDIVHGENHNGPPTNPCHVREWNHHEFSRLLQSARLQIESITHVPVLDGRQKETMVAVLRGRMNNGRL